MVKLFPNRLNFVDKIDFTDFFDCSVHLLRANSETIKLQKARN